MIDQIQILEMQNGWLAVDKPCGISVHNDPGHDLVSILPAMIGSDPLWADCLKVVSPFFVRPIHRLDRETSGVILLSTDDIILRRLSELFAAGNVRKLYLALVHGSFDETAAPPGYQTWEFPLSKTAGGRNDPAGKGRRVKCSTRYRVLQQSPRYAFLEIELQTGRKHQIRRHAKLFGHPVTGDTRYGSKKSIDYLRNTLSYSRLGLHCRQLEFIPPGQEQKVCITSKNPLTEMTQLLAEDSRNKAFD